MFHLAQILLLTTSPSQDCSCVLAFRRIEVRAVFLRFRCILIHVQTKLLYHARQICGIAQSKPDGSCRVNSVQPIYYGLCSCTPTLLALELTISLSQPGVVLATPMREKRPSGCWKILKMNWAGPLNIGREIFRKGIYVNNELVD